MGIFDKGYVSNHLDDPNVLSDLSTVLLRASSRLIPSFTSTNVPTEQGKMIIFFNDGLNTLFMIINNDNSTYAKIVDDVNEYVFTETIFDLMTGTIVNKEDIIRESKK